VVFSISVKLVVIKVIGQWRKPRCSGIKSMLTPVLVKFSSVVLTTSKGTSVSFTDTPNVACSISKHNENGRIIVRFVRLSGLNKEYFPLKDIPISLKRSKAFKVIFTLIFNKWMMVLLLLGKISEIKLSGIGAGGRAVTFGNLSILLVRTNKAMRIAEYK